MDVQLEARFDQIAAAFEAAERRVDERFDRLGELIAKSFEASDARWSARFDGLEERMGRLEDRMERLEGRMDRLEGRVDAMEVKFTEKFISVDEHFRTLHLAHHNFEERVMGTVVEIREELATISRRTRSLDGRVGRLEDGLVQLNARVDRLSDDMRQRFRAVNEP